MTSLRVILSASILGLASGFEAFSHAQISRTAQLQLSKFRSVSPMFYRDESQLVADPNMSRFPLWKSNDGLLHNDDQSEVDEYLEFLDRRYNRLRGEDRERAVMSGWVDPESVDGSAISDDVFCKENGDALCALGVASLASQRLRQKFEKVYHSTAISGSAIVIPTATLLMAGVPSVRTLSFFFAGSLSMVKMLFLLQQQIVKKHKSRLSTLIAFLSKDMTLDAARSARTVWRMGGGMKNLSWTVTVMSALFMLLLKPLSHGISKQASMS